MRLCLPCLRQTCRGGLALASKLSAAAFDSGRQAATTRHSPIETSHKENGRLQDLSASSGLCGGKSHTITGGVESRFKHQKREFAHQKGGFEHWDNPRIRALPPVDSRTAPSDSRTKDSPVTGTDSRTKKKGQFAHQTNRFTDRNSCFAHENCVTRA